jgi:transposase
MVATESEKPDERSTEGQKTMSLDEVTLKDGYQTNRELHDEEMIGLQRSVQDGGIDSSELPVVDTDNNVINGQHRVEAFRNEGYDEAEFVVMEFESESAKKDYAYSRNASGRHLDGGEKREMVRNYLMEDHVSEDVSTTEVAEFLSVSQPTVSRAMKELRQDSEVEKYSAESLSKEEKRKRTKEYIRENPDDSNREVADNVPYSHATVRTIKKEMEDEEHGQDEAESVDVDESDSEQQKRDTSTEEEPTEQEISLQLMSLFNEIRGMEPAERILFRVTLFECISKNKTVLYPEGENQNNPFVPSMDDTDDDTWYRVDKYREET